MDKSIKKVIILGSGALKIGQAGEFDYSGSQALKAMKEEGIETVLINPNIATIQTSEGVADKVYFLPITPYFVEKVIEKEKPNGILLAFGGQTALNCGTSLYQSGILEKYGVQVLGTSVDAIMITEDRDLFIKKLNEIDAKTPLSHAVESLEDALKAAEEIGYPVMVRSAYALGGQGSGICEDINSFTELCKSALSFSNQILVEESLKGWKEIEFEVIRDKNDHCFTVVPMENFDPLGIHTGESIVVAPIITLSKEQIAFLEDVARNVVRHIGIVGECNIQYAFNAVTNDYRIIEINARLSRSSALASKASGYPLAFVATKLALGYTLDQIGEMGTPNSAYLAPAVDYMIVKIPRWDLNKFQGVSHEIGSSMKSVGEIMSIGQSFEEIIQKGLRMIGQGMHGFVGNKMSFDDVEDVLSNPTDMRIFAIADAFEKGYTVEKIVDLTKIDKWFIEKLENIYKYTKVLSSYTKIEDLPQEVLNEAKRLGFSDFQIARYVEHQEGTLEEGILRVRSLRKKLQVLPHVCRINTVASEDPEKTNYLYFTYGDKKEFNLLKSTKETIVVLGSGAYRIGSSVEFDWCSVNAVQTARKSGYESVMINYNPETVSTDYDMCDRLYFDELSFERVLDVIDIEDNLKGVIVSVGGQIPNNLAMRLYRQNVPILGTSALSIDRAENRNKFSAMLDQLKIDQPRWKELTSFDEIDSFVDEVGFPVLIRPSYVLSGAAMNVCYDKEQMHKFLTMAANVSKEHPVVVSVFMQNAKEIEFDAVAKDGEVVEYAISEHVEFAGVHSGDATLVFPAQKIYFETMRRIKKISKHIAKELNISGPFNIQYLAKNNEIKVIECNLRASRSFPFVSKVIKRNFIETATQIMLGEPYNKPDSSVFDLEYIGVKASQFSFSRLQNADPVLGVDMSSTGEVGCLGDDFSEAILKSMLSVGYRVPKKGILISSGEMKSKVDLLEACKLLDEHGYKLYASHGTYNFLTDNGIKATDVKWPDEDGDTNIKTMINDKQFDLIINIPKDVTKRELTNGYIIRRGAIDFNIPLITNARLASAFITAFCSLKLEDIKIKSWNEY
ncbi:MAG: carbamoyl-phosphate synthase (glutamine-hydrolyzing) large subunit [Dysgonamonadaceae bacterium]|nr:carbamoyl-phosphate synthase (glutamine-hydrolyzing) large subunit [Dysgonamonadaceae bacterium]MDD3309124.1 carbamoyl-phosphate synthase (glutamine-hydrolyzing) large subunit [Dysgonamonadaceae bacterium]MDD4397937.1 carbamoyl-phosphate synthase (glutamine-hydrolyzing) large subunit [Dysgonamonadaceae bacterium]